MNSVDRVFIMLMFSFSIIILSSGINVLDYVTLNELVIVGVLLAFFWVVSACTFDKARSLIFRKKEVHSTTLTVNQKPIDIVPIIKEITSNSELQKFKSDFVEEDIDKIGGMVP